jgi:N-carbamoyl-L-amino-acid hydrolase
MPSGAGHDAAVFANAGVSCGMVFVRNDRGSHNPHEAMDLQDFFSGVEVLHRAIVAD